MASDVRVTVDDFAIIQALNTPGGGVFEWRDDIADEIVRDAREHSPINNPLNAVHRGGGVGEYKSSWFWTPWGSNQHLVRAYIFNESDHAQLVEWGRRSTKGRGRERFSWAKAQPPGRIIVTRGTRGYAGRGILKNAVNRALARQGLMPLA